MDQIAAHRDSTVATVADDLRTAAHSFFPDATEVAAISGHPEIVRVSAPSGIWRVRRWPEGTPRSDVTFSHEVMTLARAAGLAMTPALFTPANGNGDTTLSVGNRLFDAQRWLPGEPPPHAEIAWPEPDDRIEVPVTLPPEVFSAVVTALAHLHEATTAMAATRGIPSAPLHLLPGAVRQSQTRQLNVLRAKSRHEPAIQRWLATGERLIDSAEPIVLAATEDQETLSSVLHLGLWPAHVLIDEGAFSGLLGWERVAAGSPLLELAQATLRLRGWSDESVEEAIGAYSDVRNLAPQERRLLLAVAALDAVATTGRLLEQTYARPGTARPPSALRAAIDMMLRSMTAIDRNLNAPSAKSRRRVWNRQAPRPASSQRGGKPRERRR